MKHWRARSLLLLIRLSLSSGLQWIFIARIQTMIASGTALPKGFSIAPYFSEVWKNDAAKSELLETIKQIDEVCA